MSGSQYELLLRLKDTIVRERTAARTLGMPDLERAGQDLAELVKRLAPFRNQAPDAPTRTLIEEIRRELRRNVRLYHGAMQAILGIWSVHCQSDGDSGYDREGQRCAGEHSSRMLRGRI